MIIDTTAFLAAISASVMLYASLPLFVTVPAAFASIFGPTGGTGSKDAPKGSVAAN